MKAGDEFGNPQLIADQDYCGPMMGGSFDANDVNPFGAPGPDINDGIIQTMLSPPQGSAE